MSWQTSGNYGRHHTQLTPSGSLNGAVGKEQPGIEWAKKIHAQQTINNTPNRQRVSNHHHPIDLLAKTLKPGDFNLRHNEITTSCDDSHMGETHRGTAANRFQHFDRGECAPTSARMETPSQVLYWVNTAGLSQANRRLLGKIVEGLGAMDLQGQGKPIHVRLKDMPSRRRFDWDNPVVLTQ